MKALLLVASDSGSPSAEPHADLLQTAATAATPVQELMRIKERAKASMNEAADSRHRKAAQLLYHVAVASAFVHHGASISGRPLRKQLRLYERFADAWAGHAIGDLFREAAARVPGTIGLE